MAKFADFTKEQIAEMEQDIIKVLSQGPLTSRRFKKDIAWIKTEDDLTMLSQLLQSMSRKGTIRSEGKTWYLQSIKTCPTCKGKGYVVTTEDTKENNDGLL